MTRREPVDVRCPVCSWKLATHVQGTFQTKCKECGCIVRVTTPGWESNGGLDKEPSKALT